MLVIQSLRPGVRGHPTLPLLRRMYVVGGNSVIGEGLKPGRQIGVCKGPEAKGMLEEKSIEEEGTFWVTDFILFIYLFLL